jgi:hypothetical protein
MLDAREIEPSPSGVVAALGRALGTEAPDLERVAAAVGELGDPVVLAIDTYQLLGLADAWIASNVVPALPVNVRIVLIGRQPPSGTWVHGYGDLLGTLALENLAPADAEGILRRAGVDPAFNRIARGHPLALQLAATAGADRAGPPLRDGAIDAVVEQLGPVYLDSLDETTRRGLAAASVTRRTTIARFRRCSRTTSRRRCSTACAACRSSTSRPTAGTWMIVEPQAGDRIEDNFHLGRINYGFSTLICTPGSLSQEGRAGLAGPSRAERG